MALGRLSLLKSYAFLNESVTDYDTNYKFLLEACTKEVEEYCNRRLESSTITTEYYNGDDRNILYLNEWPVTALSAVTIWDAGTETYVAESTNYMQLLYDQRGIGYGIYYPKPGQEDDAEYGAWPKGNINITATYTAGYVTTGWDTQTVTITVETLTTAPAVGDVLTQANTGATVTVTASSATTNQITGTLSGTLNNSDTLTSDNAGATMAPTPVTIDTDNDDNRGIQFAIVDPSGWTVPDDLEYAVCTMAHLKWMEGRGSSAARRGVTGYNLVGQDFTVERYEHGMSPEVKSILKGYVRVSY